MSEYFEKRIRNDTHGLGLSLIVPRSLHEYGAPISSAILTALRESELTGRVENYAGDCSINENYVSCIFVRLPPGPRSTRIDWHQFRDSVQTHLNNLKTGIQIDERCTELVEVRAAKSTLLYAGAVLLEHGQVTQVLDEEESWFITEAQELAIPSKGS